MTAAVHYLGPPDERNLQRTPNQPTSERIAVEVCGLTLHRSRLLEFEDQIFTHRRFRLWSCGVAVAYAISIIIWWGIYKGKLIVTPDGRLPSIDFCWIWITGNFAASGNAAQIYDHTVFLAAHDTFFPPGECSFLSFFDYPPSFFFLTYPLGLLPYFSAFVVWIVATFVIYEMAIYAIIWRPVALIAAVAPSAVLKNIQLGHNGFLTAGLIGLSLATIERRPWLSGIFVGLLTYKPQFGVLFPLALLASRNWRALSSAIASSLAIVLTTAIGFGYQTWRSFIGSLFNRNASLSPDGEIELKLQSVYGLINWTGADASVSWSVFLGIALIVALATCTVWAKSIPHSLKAAFLCTGSVIVSPYVLPYDLCILSIAVAFLVKDGLARGFLPGERTSILICFAGLFVLAAPIAPAICAILLLLTARRIARTESGGGGRMIVRAR